MKKSREIIGLPIISISEGVQIGTVGDLLINPLQKNVEFLLLDGFPDEMEPRGLSYRSAEAVGEFAVTVQDRNVIIDLLKIGILKELLEKEIQIIGTKVVTRRGRFLGEVTEYAIDTETGGLTEVFFGKEEEVEQSLPAEVVITIGKEVLVVEDEGSAIAGNGDPALSREDTGNFKRGDDRSAAGVTIPLVAAKGDRPGSEPQDDLDPTEIFVQRQRQYLIGKTLFKDFKMDGGEVVAWGNQIITGELFDRVYQQLGPQKLMELALSVRD